MKIYCIKCRKYLGDIEGNIRKEIVHLCKECNIQREALELNNKLGNNTPNTFKNLFKDFL